jgi:hypothetical protein
MASAGAGVGPTRGGAGAAAASLRGGGPGAGLVGDAAMPLVVSLDLGTSGSGISIVFRPESGSTDPREIQVMMYTPGKANLEGKALTAILLDAATERIVAFGKDARKRFADACDDEVEKR